MKIVPFERYVVGRVKHGREP